MSKEHSLLTKISLEKERFKAENEKYPETITISNEIYKMIKTKQNDSYFTKPNGCVNEEFLGMLIKISLEFKPNEFQLT